MIDYKVEMAYQQDLAMMPHIYAALLRFITELELLANQHRVPVDHDETYPPPEPWMP